MVSDSKIEELGSTLEREGGGERDHGMGGVFIDFLSLLSILFSDVWIRVWEGEYATMEVMIDRNHERYEAWIVAVAVKDIGSGLVVLKIRVARSGNIVSYGIVIDNDSRKKPSYACPLAKIHRWYRLSTDHCPGLGYPGRKPHYIPPMSFDWTSLREANFCCRRQCNSLFLAKEAKVKRNVAVTTRVIDVKDGALSTEPSSKPTTLAKLGVVGG
ncbi:hypothetical protein RRG08_031587 [Elysia crispata]|uniref:Uncharacterized protein n=1 Tax=Elysia crispata TaxID=231223 RepID=A0AAE1B445_9GAST|nr:hypothetical protein RRG08_031587 [Elysia crispata]